MLGRTSPNLSIDTNYFLSLKEDRVKRRNVMLRMTAALIVLLGLSCTLLEAQDNKFRKAAKDAIPNQYIVVLKGNLAPETTKARASDLASFYGGQVKYTYQHALKGFAVRLSESAALALSKDP